MDNTKAVINLIITKKRFIDTIEEDMKLGEDLGFDSLSMVELIVDLEERLDIEIDESDLDITRLKTVGQIYSLVDKYLERKTCYTNI